MPRMRRPLIVEAKANTHLTHLEELVLTQGFDGYLLARAFLMELLETLKGNTKSKVSTSVKWDGAPAIFAGINPDNGKFFVGTKSVQNKKDPLINYTVEDIIKNHSKAKKDGDGNYERDEEGNVDHGGLVDKLLRALEELPKLGIKNILQGDFMFDDTMLSTVNIDGEPHYQFTPNTITYTVPVDSKLGREIGRSRFGIVFHTTYGGVDEMGRPTDVSYGADVSNLNRPPGIWFDDAFFDDDTGTVTLTTDEESAVRSLIKQADSVNNKIDYNGLPSDFLNIYINNEIRQGQFLENPKESYEGFLGWYQSRIEKKIDSLKTEKGRMRAFNQGEEIIKQFESKKGDILNLFKVSRLLFEAKNIFIAKYNNAVYNTRHFLDDGSGDLVATNPEGYVAVDVHGNGVKFVDRLEFSRANFLMDKGFKKDVNESQILEVFWGGSGYSVKMTLREWADKLPKTTTSSKSLFKKISAGVPITTLVLDGAKVKPALAAAVNWGLNEGLGAWAIEKGIKTAAAAAGVPADGAGLDSELSKIQGTLNVLDEESGETVLYLPGGFKPPHKGHFALVRDALEKNPGAKLIIMSGDSARKGHPVSLAQSKKVWDIYLNAIGKAGQVEVRELKNEPQYDENGNVLQKPMRGAGVKEPAGGWTDDVDPRRRSVAKSKIIRDDDGQPVMLDISTKSPINSIANAIRFTDKPTSSKIVASGADPGNANEISNYLKRLGLDVETEIVPVRVKSGDTKMSATDMRRSIGQGMESFSQYLPDELSDEEAQEVFTILGGGLEEMSGGAGAGGNAMGNGAVGGASGRAPRRPATYGSEKMAREKDEFLKEEMVSEVMNYLLGISVG